VIRDVDTGRYLKEYDPDFIRDPDDPRTGWADWTATAAEALVFASPLTAWACYSRISRVRPLRPDGKSNRPLTAYTVSVESLKAPSPWLDEIMAAWRRVQ